MGKPFTGMTFFKDCEGAIEIWPSGVDKRDMAEQHGSIAQVVFPRKVYISWVFAARWPLYVRG